MIGAEERTGRAAHAATRWPTVVRTLVLLGVPPGGAERLAAQAVARLLDQVDEGDPEVALFACVVAVWEDDRTAWWDAGCDAGAGAWLADTGYADLEPALDLLDPATRVRLLLSEVARLAPEQVDDVVLAGASWPRELGPEVVRVAEAIETGPPSVDRVARASGRRRVRRRAGTVAALAATAAVVIGVLVAVVDPQEAAGPGDPGDGGDPGDAAPVDATPLGLPTQQGRFSPDELAAVTVPWYDGRTVHLGAVTHDVEGLAGLTDVAGGAVGVLLDGTVVMLDDRGGLVQTVGATRSGGTVVGSPSSASFAFVDLGGDLDIAQSTSVDLPRGARVVVHHARTTYLDVPDGHLVVADSGAVRRRSGPAPVAVAGGGRDGVTQVVEVDGGLGVSTGGPATTVLDGVTGARLSSDGRYLLTRDDASVSRSLDRVFDVRREQFVRLPIPDNGGIVDSAFGAGDTLVLVLARSETSQSRLAGPRGDFAGYEIATCRLVARTCEIAARLDTAESPPLLAH